MNTPQPVPYTKRGLFLSALLTLFTAVLPLFITVLSLFTTVLALFTTLVKFQAASEDCRVKVGVGNFSNFDEWAVGTEAG